MSFLLFSGSWFAITGEGWMKAMNSECGEE